MPVILRLTFYKPLLLMGIVNNALIAQSNPRCCDPMVSEDDIAWTSHRALKNRLKIAQEVSVILVFIPIRSFNAPSPHSYR